MARAELPSPIPRYRKVRIGRSPATPAGPRRGGGSAFRCWWRRSRSGPTNSTPHWYYLRSCCRKATGCSRSRISSFRCSACSSPRSLLFDAVRQGAAVRVHRGADRRAYCLYIAGEEMSWGQHFFHWNTPEYWAEVNRQEETNLHNTYAIFEKTPRSILETEHRSSAASSFRSPRSSIRGCAPAAPRCSCRRCAGADRARRHRLQAGRQAAAGRPCRHHPADRPSETIETYLYFFILAYLIVYARRLKELEVAEGALPK